MTGARKGPARPIRNKRDFEGASAVAKKMASEPPHDSTVELRLQSLLRALDAAQFQEEDEEDVDFDQDNEPALRRRWSDDIDGAG